MGETRPYRIVLAAGAAALVAAAAVALTSCSALGGGPAAAVSTASGPVLDPSVPSATPTETVASDTPLPTATATATEAPTSGPTSSAAARTAVVPFITTADWDASAKVLDVSAIVPGVVESSGTCTVTVTSGATTRTAEGDGVAASSYTGCEAVSFSGLAAGTWKVSVRYESAKSAGTSAAGSVQVG